MNISYKTPKLIKEEPFQDIFLEKDKAKEVIKPHQAFISKEITVSGAKHFFIMSWDVFFEIIQEKSLSQLCLHEEFYNKPVKLVFDIDYENPTISFDEFINDMEKLIDFLLVYLKKMEDKYTHRFYINKKDFIFLTACSNNKYSLHIITSLIEFKTRQHLEKFLHEFDQSYNLNNKKYTIDCKFKSLRIYYNIKKKSPDRRLYYYDRVKKIIIKEFNLDILKSSLVTYNTQKTSLIKYHNTNVEIINNVKNIKNNNNLKINYENYKKTEYVKYTIKSNMMKILKRINDKFYKSYNINKYNNEIWEGGNYDKNKHILKYSFKNGLCLKRLNDIKRNHLESAGVFIKIYLDSGRAFMGCLGDQCNKNPLSFEYLLEIEDINELKTFFIYFFNY
jgi:hypothetical protein